MPWTSHPRKGKPKADSRRIQNRQTGKTIKNKGKAEKKQDGKARANLRPKKGKRETENRKTNYGEQATGKRETGNRKPEKDEIKNRKKKEKMQKLRKTGKKKNYKEAKRESEKK